MDGPVADDTITDGNPVAFDVVANKLPAQATQTPRAVRNQPMPSRFHLPHAHPGVELRRWSPRCIDEECQKGDTCKIETALDQRLENKGKEAASVSDHKILYTMHSDLEGSKAYFQTVCRGFYKECLI